MPDLSQLKHNDTVFWKGNLEALYRGPAPSRADLPFSVIWFNGPRAVPNEELTVLEPGALPPRLPMEQVFGLLQTNWREEKHPLTGHQLHIAEVIGPGGEHYELRRVMTENGALLEIFDHRESVRGRGLRLTVRMEVQ